MSSPSESPRPGKTLFEGLVSHHAGGELPREVLDRLQEKLAGTTALEPDMERLWEMLGLVLNKAGRRPGGHRSDLTLLNLACGPCREATVLSAFFAQRGQCVRHFAMDLRSPQIDKAKRRHEGIEKLFQEAGVPRIRPRDESSTIEFFADDATRLLGYGQIPSCFDVAFIRHQNLYHDRAIWHRIFEFALHSLEEDGVLVITSYFDREHLLALEVFRQLGGVILASERNPISRALPVEGMSMDRHVAVIAKGELDSGQI